MRYYITTVLLFSFFLILSGQTIVSTEIQSRNVVLEDFTGIYCVNCPDGHERANNIKEQYPDDFFIINHHTGYFATPQDESHPNFVTRYGASLDQRSQLTGYPAGTINRHSFPGFSMNDDEPNATAQYRQTWKETTEIHLLEDSYVNMGVEANWNYQTNEITVHVEAYFTGNSPVDKNLMNIALLQDSTFAYQIGKGLDYNHSNRLVDFITPLDGDIVNNTTEGSFYNKTFTYSVPDNYNEIPVDISNLKIVVFMVEGFNEIESAAACNLTYSNIPGQDISIFSIERINPNCSGKLSPSIKIQNNAGAEITSLDFEYNIENQAVQYYHWNGSLTSYEKTNITLPEFTFDLEETNGLEVKIVTSDDDISNNYGSQTFIKDTPIVIGHEKITVEVQVRYNGSEITWELLGSSNEVIMSGGPYDNFDDTVHSQSTVLDPDNCYNFFIYDEEGGSFVPTLDFYKIKVNNEIIATSDVFDFIDRVGINTEDKLASNDITFAKSSINIFPNPTSTEINIVDGKGMNLEILDIVGNSVFKKVNILNLEVIDVSSYKTGVYLVKLSNGHINTSQRILISE